MSDANSTVLVIDDDPDLRASVGRLLRSLGINVQLFASISDFLKSVSPDCPTCLVLDIRLPGQSGLDLQCELAAANREIPIIFITGHGDIPMSVQAMKRGAIEFLTKPFRDQDLLDAIQLGLSRDRTRRENDKDLAVFRERFGSLSPREREIVIQVARGRLSRSPMRSASQRPRSKCIGAGRCRRCRLVRFRNSAGWLTSSSWCLTRHNVLRA